MLTEEGLGGYRDALAAAKQAEAERKLEAALDHLARAARFEPDGNEARQLREKLRAEKTWCHQTVDRAWSRFDEHDYEAADELAQEVLSRWEYDAAHQARAQIKTRLQPLTQAWTDARAAQDRGDVIAALAFANRACALAHPDHEVHRLREHLIAAEERGVETTARAHELLEQRQYPEAIALVEEILSQWSFADAEAVKQEAQHRLDTLERCLRDGRDAIDKKRWAKAAAQLSQALPLMADTGDGVEATETHHALAQARHQLRKRRLSLTGLALIGVLASGALAFSGQIQAWLYSDPHAANRQARRERTATGGTSGTSGTSDVKHPAPAKQPETESGPEHQPPGKKPAAENGLGHHPPATKPKTKNGVEHGPPTETPKTKSSESYRDQIRSADSLFYQGDFVAAERAYRTALDLAKDHGVANSELAGAHHRLALAAHPKVENEAGMTLLLIPHPERPFYLGETEVTQKQWRTVMGQLPNGLRHQTDDLPIAMVSWDDVGDFLGKLSNREGRQGVVYRLPTTTEWQHACRAGGADPQYWRLWRTPAELRTQVWYQRNSRGKTHPVRKKNRTSGDYTT